MIVNLTKKFFSKWHNAGFFPAVNLTKEYFIHNFRKFYTFSKIELSRKTNGATVTKEINGSLMNLDLSKDSPHKIDRTLYVENIREEGSTKTLGKILENKIQENYPNVHVFDIGANVGYFTLLEAKILREKANIYAIEAEPENVKHLKENIKLNNYSNIEVIQTAIGEENKKTKLNISQHSNTHQIDAVDYEKNPDQINITMKTLDSIIENKQIPEEQPIIIRMDIEGYEEHAFEGMEKLITSKRPMYIALELHDRKHNPHKKILEILERNNFKLEYLSRDGGDSIEEINDYSKVPDPGNVHVFANRLT